MPVSMCASYGCLVIPACFLCVGLPFHMLVCVVQSVGFLLQGHPGSYNGVYRKVSEHNGWPVLQNAEGRYCYRFQLSDAWFLEAKFTPEIDRHHARIVSSEGPLPSGDQTWEQWNGTKSVSYTHLTLPTKA